MEMYQFDMGIGQSYGYIIYRKQIGSVNKISLPPRVHDYAQVWYSLYIHLCAYNMFAYFAVFSLNAWLCLCH